MGRDAGCARSISDVPGTEHAACSDGRVAAADRRWGRRNYQVSVLQVVDENTPDGTIEQIECWWKNKLLSRRFGLNRN